MKGCLQKKISTMATDIKETREQKQSREEIRKLRADNKKLDEGTRL